MFPERFQSASGTDNMGTKAPARMVTLSQSVSRSSLHEDNGSVSVASKCKTK